jgi:hypothetical protein
MGSLSCLPKLSSIQIWINPTFGPPFDLELSLYFSDAAFAHRMLNVSPALEKIYVKIFLPGSVGNGTCWVWEYQGLQWCGWQAMEGEQSDNSVW